MSGGSGTGGTNDNSSLSSAGGGSGAFPNDVFITSTPKTDINGSSLSSSSVIQHSTPLAYEAGNINISSPSSASYRPSGEVSGQYMSHKRLSGGDDWRSSSQESSPYASTSRMNIYAAPASSSSPRDPAVITSSSSSSMPNSYTSPNLSNHLHNPHPAHMQAGNLNVNNSNKSNSTLERELPPVPTDPPPPIPAAERLDRLTMLSSSRDHPVHSQMSNHQNWPPNKRDEEVVMRRHGPADLGRRTSEGPLDRHHPNNNSGSSSSSGLLPDQFQPPVPRSQPPMNVTPTNSKQQKNEDNSVVSGHNPRRPPANLMPGQNNHHPFHRTRPASAMGSSPHIRGVISRPPGEGRPRQQQQQHQQGFSNDRGGRVPVPGNQPQGPNSQSQPERPKSVPPHMFIPTSGGEVGQSQGHPIPPPRRAREDFEVGGRASVREAPDGHEPPRDSRSSSVSLLREPSRSSSRGPPSTSSSDATDTQAPSQAYSKNNSQQQLYHQQRFSSQNMDTSRHNVSGRPSQPFPDQHQATPPGSQGHFASSTNPSRVQQPRPVAGPRPESLNLAGSRGQGLTQAQPPPRSHSSIGQPMSTFLPSGAGLYGRSTTPGPHPVGRRDSAPAMQQAQQERPMHDTGQQRLPPSGAPLPRSGQGAQSRQEPGNANYGSVGPNRPGRAGSLPQDIAHGGSMRPDDRNYPQARSASSSSGSQHYSQRPPVQQQQSQQQRPQSRSGFGTSPTTNGPYSGHNNSGYQQHSNSPVSSSSQSHPQKVQVPPQIRSQGRPVSSSQQNTPPLPPPPANISNRQVGSPPSSVSSPLSEQAEKSSSGLSAPKGAPSAAPNSEERVEGKEQTKTTSSIWYEYGCV